MKRSWIVISAMMLVCCLTGIGNALPIGYSDTIIFGDETGTWGTNVLSKPVGTTSGFAGTFTWHHDITTDFQIPYDTVNSSTLTIKSRRAENGNDVVSIVDFTPALGSLSATGNSEVETFFNVPLGIFTIGWASGDPLNISLAYNLAEGSVNSTSLTMVSSVFNLSYDNGTASPPGGDNGGPGAAVVPEPSTMLLLGVGLAGLAVVTRRRKG